MHPVDIILIIIIGVPNTMGFRKRQNEGLQDCFHTSNGGEKFMGCPGQVLEGDTFWFWKRTRANTFFSYEYGGIYFLYLLKRGDMDFLGLETPENPDFLLNLIWGVGTIFEVETWRQGLKKGMSRNESHLHPGLNRIWLGDQIVLTLVWRSFISFHNGQIF